MNERLENFIWRQNITARQKLILLAVAQGRADRIKPLQKLTRSSNTSVGRDLAALEEKLLIEHERDRHGKKYIVPELNMEFWVK